MPARVYECMFLLDSSKVSGDVANADKQIRTIFERNQAEVLVSRPWDERRLSYPIKHQKKGLYYLTYFSADGPSLTGIQRDCALNEMVLRQMILQIDPKLVEIMLSLAKGEHATALHNIQEDPADEAVAAAGGGSDEGSRRPKRTPVEVKE